MKRGGPPLDRLLAKIDRQPNGCRSCTTEAVA